MPVRIDGHEVERIARLASLTLTPDERARYALQLEEILRYAEQVQAVDTRGAPAYFDRPSAPGTGRPDTPAPSLARGTALENAPARSADGALFKVPRVIGG